MNHKITNEINTFRSTELYNENIFPTIFFLIDCIYEFNFFCCFFLFIHFAIRYFSHLFFRVSTSVCWISVGEQQEQQE